MAQDIDPESKNNLLFWENSTFHPNIVKELRRRKTVNNIGVNYKDYNLKDGDINNHFDYKGPLTSWIRVCSNGNGKAVNERIPRSNFLKKQEYNGFVLDSGGGFFDTYGFQNNNGIIKPSKLRLGRECDGTAIYLESEYIDQNSYTSNGSSSPIGLPSPGITGVNVINNTDFATVCTVNFVCYGIAQLEFLIPFFLTPGIHIFVEFGWNLFNNKSLLPLNDIPTLKNEIKEPVNFLKRYYNSFGNYGSANGTVIDYGYKSSDNIKFDCFFKVMNVQALFAGNPITMIQTKQTSSEKYEITSDIKTTISEHLKLVYTSVENEENFLYTLQRESNNSDDNLNGVKFYNEKAEDRIFCGRNENLFKRRAKKEFLRVTSPIGFPTKEVLVDSKEYFKAPVNESDVRYSAEFNMGDVNKIYSNRSSENNDFDKDGDNTTDVWLQLDFIIEYLNLYLNDGFKIDISDVVVNAHPNLISCNRNVLIPNPIAPKINYGYHVKNNQSEEIIDFVLNQYKISKIVGDKDDVYKSFKKSKQILKQFGSEFYRENLDAIINYIPYLRNKTSESTRSFPFKQDYTSASGKKYKKYYYGFLKNIYFSKNRLREIVLDDNTKTVHDVINSVLSEINSSVADFWKLVISRTDKNTISMIDVGINNIQEIYQFELGTTNSFVHNYKFDVTLSNEQAVNVIFKSGNNAYNESGIERADISTESIPSMVYEDRLTDRENYLDKKPVLRNNTLGNIQSNGTNPSVLKMSFKVIENNDFSKGSPKDLVACLNLPSELSGILISMLQDNDYENNSAVYANVADNFVFEFVLDGIYGFKVFENFSIKNLPKPYSPENVIFQIKDVEHAITNGNWVTTVKALLKGIYKHKEIRYIEI